MTSSPLGRPVVPARLGVAAALALTALAAGCPDNLRFESGGAGPLAESAAARRLVTELRARFQVTGSDGTKHAALPPSPVAQFEQRGALLVPRFAESLHVAANLKRADVALPTDATGALRVVDRASGIALEAALVGATRAPAELGDGYLVYRGATADADLVQRVTPEGTEDFLAFAAAPAAPEIRYTLAIPPEVAGLRLVGATLELLDAHGTPRLRVAPPTLVGADGARVSATLTVTGCDLDRDPAPPWNRPLTAPAATRCELRIAWADVAIAYPALLDPSWQTTGSMATPRLFHTLTTLRDGDAIVAGGQYDTAILDSVERFHPASGTWSATGSLDQKRRLHAALLLAPAASGNGAVDPALFVTGGGDCQESCEGSATTERYDPITGLWTPAASMNDARGSHTATLLQDGRVLVVGGFWRGALASAELYDPSTNRWSSTGALATPRGGGHTASLLPSGEVLVVGGTDAAPSALTSAELYAGGLWSPAAPMAQARHHHTATVLADGRVLVTGGYPIAIGNLVPLASTELYDRAADRFDPGPLLAVARAEHTASLLPTHDVFVVGGFTASGATRRVERFDHDLATWVAAADLEEFRYGHRATLLADASLLVAGGYGSELLASAELFALDPPGAACASSADCATGICVSGVCGRDAGELHAPLACGGGACTLGACDTGHANCDGLDWNGCEADLASDAANCGQCAKVCDGVDAHGSASCTNGTCGITCEADFARCPGWRECLYVGNDVNNCGACGVQCTAGAHQTAGCWASHCTTRCDTGFGDCDGDKSNGCELDVTSDPKHCGACWPCVTQGGTASCTNGVCSLVCDPGFADCDGQKYDGCEANLAANDGTYCGGSCTPCPSNHGTASCNGAACQLRCDPGFAECNGDPLDGCETDIRTVANCGACGAACVAPASPGMATACDVTFGCVQVPFSPHGDHLCGPNEAACSAVGLTALCEGNLCEASVADCGGDSDGDGLPDAWERQGIRSPDGTVLLDLPALGADPSHKDVFVEIDYMTAADHTHALRQEARDALLKAFADAPVMNPDGTTGIRLHLDADIVVGGAVQHEPGSQSDALPDTEVLVFGSGACPGHTSSAHTDLKAAHFAAARHAAFHYVVFGHDCGCEGCGYAGVGESPGNDIDITLGYRAGPQFETWLRMEQALSLMHELGHNLGLSHSGDGSRDDDYHSYKPNYLSVMNYRFASFGLPLPGGGFALDYSRQRLPDLKEAELDERVGIQGDGRYDTTYNTAKTRSGDFMKPAPGQGAIDWNDDGIIEQTKVSANINVNNPDEIQVLHGADDWANLRYGFQCSDGYAMGVVLDEEPHPYFGASGTDPYAFPDTVRDLGQALSSCAFASPDAFPVPPTPEQATALLERCLGPSSGPLPTDASALQTLFATCTARGLDFPKGQQLTRFIASCFPKRDTTPPILACPPLKAECAQGGADVTVAPTATDDTGVTAIACTPGSGHFTLGTTPEACTASDAAGNKAQCAFDVSVIDTQAPRIQLGTPLVLSEDAIATQLQRQQIGVSIALSLGQCIGAGGAFLDVCRGALGIDTAGHITRVEMQISSTGKPADAARNLSKFQKKLTAPLCKAFALGGGASFTIPLPLANDTTLVRYVVRFAASDPSGNTSVGSAEVSVSDTLRRRADWATKGKVLAPIGCAACIGDGCAAACPTAVCH